MKNTLENKEKFFALYWGQDILKIPLIVGSPQRFLTSVVISHSEWIDRVNVGHLELKPLSQITDEDAIEVADILKVKSDEQIKIILGEKHNRIDAVKRIINSENGTGVSTKRFIEAIDFLRSKGYALPWMGISVEEQIEFGWVKLKE